MRALLISALLSGCCSHSQATTYDRVHMGGPAREDMIRKLCVNCAKHWNEVARCEHR